MLRRLASNFIHVFSTFLKCVPGGAWYWMGRSIGFRNTRLLLSCAQCTSRSRWPFDPSTLLARHF